MVDLDAWLHELRTVSFIDFEDSVNLEQEKENFYTKEKHEIFLRDPFGSDPIVYDLIYFEELDIDCLIQLLSIYDSYKIYYRPDVMGNICTGVLYGQTYDWYSPLCDAEICDALTYYRRAPYRTYNHPTMLGRLVDEAYFSLDGTTSSSLCYRLEYIFGVNHWGDINGEIGHSSMHRWINDYLIPYINCCSYCPNIAAAA